MLFTSAEREQLRADLLAAARADPRLTGVAITGSAALGNEDRWSDIDLAFGVDGDIQGVVAEWTTRMYDNHGAVHHVDVHAGAWLYRVFLLRNTLQVDLAFTPELYARAPSFKLVFGRAAEPAHTSPPDPEELLGMAWLHALHARSARARGRLWQAEYMIGATRDLVLKLACLRYQLPPDHGRGIDRLPSAVLDPLRDSFVANLSADELARGFATVVDALMREIDAVDAGLGKRLHAVLEQLRDVAL